MGRDDRGPLRPDLGCGLDPRYAPTVMRVRVVLLGLLLAGACERRSDPPPPASSAARSAPLPSALPVASPAPDPPAAPDASSVPGPDGAADARAAPVGGNWLKCYASFRPRADPKLDVLRLGTLCGPSNGMRKVTDAREAEVADGGAGREHRWAARSGDCYRIFAVGDPSVEDLDVEVYDPRGARIAWDTSDDRWPIVKPDGPFCVFSDGDYRAVVRAQRGAGRYAVEIWRLR